jgi:hypothetical protein
LAEHGESYRRIQERGEKAGIDVSDKLPAWYKEPPEGPDPAVERLFLDAWGYLSTCRQIGMAVGPIPFHLMVWYAERRGFDQDTTDMFCEVLLEMDSAWLKKRAEEAPSTPSKSKPQTKTRRSR